MEISSSSSDSHHSKGLKRSSSAAIKLSSSLMAINIDDLPEAVLLEIVCRLPSYKYVAQCKCVSKRWCTLISDPCFILSFLHCQRDSDQMVHTLINRYGEEFLGIMSSSREALSPLFQRIMRFHGLEKEPVVVGAYNDLVLCCASHRYQRDYYICNPCTYQWLPLPPPPEVFVEFTPVGFICDLPYYQRKEGDTDQKERKHIQVNSEYRARVVRLIICGNVISQFKVQIFSTETGEWTESILSSPSLFGDTVINVGVHYHCNGVLYWMTYMGDFLVGLDPFMITEKNTASPGDHHKCRFIKFDRPDKMYDLLSCLGVRRGCLRLCSLDSLTQIITVWELNDEAISAEASQFCLENTGVDYEWETDLDYGEIPGTVAFDPNNDGTLYLHIDNINAGTEGNYIYMYEMKTGLFSKVCRGLRQYDFFQMTLPCLPTPLPRRKATSIVGSQPSE